MGICLSLVSVPWEILGHTLNFYRGFFFFLRGKAPSECPYFKTSGNDSDDDALLYQYARIHTYSLATVFRLYNSPHYRKGSYRDDLIDNLRNVAVPGTGVPLSTFVYTRLTALPLVLILNPLVCAVSSLHYGLWVKRSWRAVAREYAVRLLAPDDWFSYWRLNCNLAALHAWCNDGPVGYDMENKWTFLEEGERRGVPVSPFLKTDAVVLKHRNEEGGLGIHFYKNATVGGDWIIQERIHNSDWVKSVLPPDAPLSTFRVITLSRASLRLDVPARASDVVALSCVFRAGRQGAATDHDSILFDVDGATGELLPGTTNAHWYRLGLIRGLLRTPWRSQSDTTHHPDGNVPVAGRTVPDFANMKALVEESHLKLCPDVPLVGWDVVLSDDTKLPLCLLEVNLSCNFFRGSFDKKLYLDFMDEAFETLHQQRRNMSTSSSNSTKKSN